MVRSGFAVAVGIAAMVAVAGVAISAQQTANTNKQVTIVMRGGAQHTGTLVYHNNGNLNLIENGRDQAYPIDNIAVVEFASGQPPASELNQLPPADTMEELQHHMLVLNSGQVIHGRMYTITNSDVVFNTASGHQNYSLNDVSRMYFSPTAARAVFANELNAPAGAVPTTGQQAANGGAITVNANQAWTDTGITVQKGQRLSFSTTGEIAVTSGSAPSINANGSGSSRSAPIPAMGVGGLIARVANSKPFPIGAGSQQITMPTNGRLYLGINDSNVSDNSGAFTVTIGR